MQRPFSGEHEQSYQVHFVLPQAILGDSGSGLLSAAREEETRDCGSMQCNGDDATLVLHAS